MRTLPTLAIALALATSARTQAQAQTPAQTQANPALQAALRNYPPILLGNNVRATLPDGTIPKPRACPAPGARVEQQGGPPTEYLGASPKDPTLCRMKIGSDVIEAWYGIWATDWPGADAARPALDRVIHGHTGEVAGFDTAATPTIKWHDLIRLDGVEDISLLGKTYTALKLSHYREGFGGNTYRSVSTVWKDVATGMLLYGTYQHISGAPALDGTLAPTAIVPAR